MRLPTLALAGTLALAACGTVDYAAAPEGEFQGSLFVMWVGEGDMMGDGLFVYVPNPRDPLRFVRANPDATLGVIEPEMIYTDGGSIPRPATLFRGFSPWGYAPAYIVHDWLFVARHCLTDGTPTEAEEAVDGMPFIESAEITAEAIKTLIASGQVAQNDVAPRVISGTVAGPISYDRWQAEGACDGHRVRPEHRRAAELGIPGAAVPRAGFALTTLDDGRVVRVRPAQLVATVSF